MNSNPALKRKGPYFQFVMNRIQPLNASSNFPMYLYSYSSYGTGKPYAYFSSGKAANGYIAYTNNSVLGPSDCPSLIGVNAGGQSAPLLPYNQPPAANQPLQFYYPDTFQIISAGKNATFGRAGLDAHRRDPHREGRHRRHCQLLQHQTRHHALRSLDLQQTPTNEVR